MDSHKTQQNDTGECGFEIRIVGHNDLAALTEMIFEFARYEGVEETSVDVKKLRKHLLEQPCGVALIALENGVPCAFATYSECFVAYSSGKSFYIDSLFVRDNFRTRGYGRKIMQRIIQEAERVGATSLMWACYRWNKTAEGFYRALGAEMLDWNVWSLYL